MTQVDERPQGSPELDAPEERANPEDRPDSGAGASRVEAAAEAPKPERKRDRSHRPTPAPIPPPPDDFIELSVVLQDFDEQERKHIHTEFLGAVQRGEFDSVPLDSKFKLLGQDLVDELIGVTPRFDEWRHTVSFRNRISRLNRDSAGGIVFSPLEAREHFQEIATARRRPPPRPPTKPAPKK